MIPGSAAPLLLGQTSGGGDFSIERSLRFNSADTAYLNRTPSSAGNRRTWTWSGWVKRNKTGHYSGLFGGASGSNTEGIYITNADEIYVPLTGQNHFYSPVLRDLSAWYHIVVAVDTTQGTNTNRIKTYINGVELTSGDVRSAGWPSQNAETAVNNTGLHTIGRNAGNTGSYGEYYLTEVNFVDGQQLAATDFGAFDDNGVWQAIDTAGLTFGTNGFRLKFADNSSNAALGTDSSGNSNTWTVNNLTAAAPSTATITHARIYSCYSGGARGANYDVDYSDDGSSWTTAFTGNMSTTGCGLITGTGVGNGSYGAHKYWRYVIGSSTTIHHPNAARYVLSDGTTDYNVVVYYADNCNDQGSFANVSRILTFPANPEGVDSLVDSPTNAATPTDTGAGGEVVGNYATWNPLSQTYSTLPAITDGNLTEGPNAGGTVLGTIAVSSGKWYWEIAVDTIGGALVGATSIDGALTTNQPGYFANSASYIRDGRVKNNGSDVGNYATYTAGDIIGVALDMDNGAIKFYKNNTLVVTINSNISGTWTPAVADFNGSGSILNANFGQRAFSYPLSGYKSLNTANLPTPTIADGSQYFDIDLYGGTGSALERSNFSFNPDFLWFKQRSGGSTSHALFDVIRGGNKRLQSNNTNDEVDVAQYGGGVTSFDSDGFTLGTWSSINASSETYVAWAWDAGTSTVSNTDGTGTTNVQVRANPSAGFSIVTYTGGSSSPANSDSGDSFGHGLGAAPKLVICKKRTGGNSWPVYHASTTLGALVLDGTNALDTSSYLFAKKHPTSSVVYLGNNPEINNSSHNYVAYCFAPVAGYSAVGSYTNPSSSDGAFVHLGFRPAFLLIRCAENISSSSGTGDWIIKDATRSPFNNPSDGKTLVANVSNAEDGYYGGGQAAIDILSNGFKIRHPNSSPAGDPGRLYIFYAVAENPFQANGGLAR